MSKIHRCLAMSSFILSQTLPFAHPNLHLEDPWCFRFSGKFFVTKDVICIFTLSSSSHTSQKEGKWREMEKQKERNVYIQQGLRFVIFFSCIILYMSGNKWEVEEEAEIFSNSARKILGTHMKKGERRKNPNMVRWCYWCCYFVWHLQEIDR